MGRGAGRGGAGSVAARKGGGAPPTVASGAREPDGLGGGTLPADDTPYTHERKDIVELSEGVIRCVTVFACYSSSSSYTHDTSD